MRIRALLTLASTALVSLALGSALSASASAAPQNAAPYPPPPCPTLSVSTTTPLPGAAITVTGSSFAPDATIRLELHTKVYVLRTVSSDGSGGFSTQVTMPSGVEGPHVIVAVGGDVAGATGCPADPIQQLTIQTPAGPDADTPGTTAFTGVDIALLVGAAAVLLAAGVLFNRRGRARRPSR